MSDADNLINGQQIVSDMEAVVSDAEEILRETAGIAGDKMSDLRERMGEHLHASELHLADAKAALLEKTKAVACATDDYVCKNPWQSVGIAAGVGLLLGIIIGRR